jgi:glutamate formiminotransferase / formiminotetrahydrofolate cyclodeaminase
MNMTDYHKSQLFKAYELVKMFADRYGVPVVGSEIVGLTPMDALIDSAEYYLRLENFSRDQILEKRLFNPSSPTLTDMSLSSFSEEVASRKATPGGGSVAAYMGALAAGLLCMVSRITLGKKDPQPSTEHFEHVLKTGEDLRARFLKLVGDDAESFNAVMQAFKIPKDQQDARNRAIQQATLRAAEVPLWTLDNSVQTLRLAHEAAENASKAALSDVTTSVAAARAASEGAASNVLINLDSLEDKDYVEKTRKRVIDLQTEAASLTEKVSKIIANR